MTAWELSVRWQELRIRDGMMGLGRIAPVAFLLAAILAVGAMVSPVEGQVLNRLRRRAEEALDQASVLQRLLEEPPGITTSIHDAHTEIPFLDDHNPRGSANMGGLPRDSWNAFFAPPGLYEMVARSYCIHAGTYGPTEGTGYALAPLEGEMAPILSALVRKTVDHPEISQEDVQSLIWALQSQIPINEMSSALQLAAETLLDPRQVDRLSEGFMDMAKEELLIEARDRMPDPVRRVAEAEADLRELLRSGADFGELEEAAVLMGAPPLSEQVREVPSLRWNYHPDGYFIRFDPDGYSKTYVQAYVPEEHVLGRDGNGQLTEIMGPRGIRLTLEYGEAPDGGRGKIGLIRSVRLLRGGNVVGEWPVEGWTFVGDELVGEVAGGTVDGRRLETRREAARELRRQTREVVSAAQGADSGRPGEDLTDLSHLRMALLEAGGLVPKEVADHLANAWQYALCLEAGGCAPVRVGQRGLPEGSLPQPGLHGPSVGPETALGEVWVSPAYFRAGGGASIDSGGNVAAPGNTGGQRLLQSGKPTVEKANLAMKALGIFLALADVIGSGSLGSAAYNALGLGGLPAGHLGLPMMMAGAMISQVTDAWSSATDALAGDTGSEGAGDEGGDSGASEGGGDEGWSGGVDTGGIDDPGGLDPDPSDSGIMGEGEDRSESRSDGEDYENTPPPSPPPNPSPAPAGGGGGGDVSGERANAVNDFTESLIATLYHSQGLTDSQMRQDGACRAGSTEWAGRHADLAGEHQRQAGLGMIESARRLERLLEIADAEGVLESPFAYAEDIAAVQERLFTQGWSADERRIAALLGITDSEMDGLRRHLLAQEAEGMEGDLQESARLWAKELRTAGILWMALPAPSGSCR